MTQDSFSFCLVYYFVFWTISSSALGYSRICIQRSLTQDPGDHLRKILWQYNAFTLEWIWLNTVIEIISDMKSDISGKFYLTNKKLRISWLFCDNWIFSGVSFFLFYNIWTYVWSTKLTYQLSLSYFIYMYLME